MTPLSRARQYSALLQFIALGFIWGASFLFMKVALEGVSFWQVVWSREILGALTLAVIMIVGRHKLPREPIVWLHFIVISLTNCVIPHLLFAWSQQHVTSGLAAIYNSFTPLATAILAALLYRVEQLGGQKIFGVILGVVGVLLIIAPWSLTLDGSLWGQLACLAAAISYGVAIGYLRKFISYRPIPGVTVAFMNVGYAAVVMLALTPVIALEPVNLTWPVVLSLIALGAVGTGIAYMWNINVLRAWGPTASSTVTYVIPVVAVALGVIVLGETLSWNEPVGAVIVLLGILFVQQRLRFGSRTTAVLGQ